MLKILAVYFIWNSEICKYAQKQGQDDPFNLNFNRNHKKHIFFKFQASVEIACEWQACMGGEVFLKDLDCELASPRQFQERRLLNKKRR